MGGGGTTLCLEEILDQAQAKVNLIIAFRGFSAAQNILCCHDKINRIVDKDCWAGNTEVDLSYITYDWVIENYDKLERVYRQLTDKKSQEVFTAYINQKISMEWGYLSRTKSNFQYFEEEIIKLSEHEVFVDCGAYDGDSALVFMEALKRQGVMFYDAILSFEPDYNAYERLCKLGLKNHYCIQGGVADRVSKAEFLEDETAGRIVVRDGTSLDKENEVCLETIDHVLKSQRVTLIKMDIEGMELAALRGAKDTIQRWKPKLAICVYHKKEDLWEIADYIYRLVPQYKFYMRNYEDTATEIVLYAVI